MKLIVVNDGTLAINANSVTKVAKQIVTESSGNVFIHTKDDEEIFLVGKYEKRHALETAFDELLYFLANDENGVFDCPYDELLWVKYPSRKRLD